MCGRYSNTRTKGDEVWARLAGRLGVALPESDAGFGRFNIAPTEEVVAAVDDQDGRRVAALRWGLVPPWAEEAKPRFAMINARSETVLERPAYRGLIQEAAHRCLVLADGWYEWQGPEDPRQPRRPVHFALASGDPFCFAGLWARTSASCTILTCTANELARPIHDRMPVVLAEPAAWEAWLDPSLDGQAAAQLLAPLPSAELSVRAANPVVNKAGHDGPDCLEPELTLL
jgi:putative SOS response-associated peptidase YedK